MTRPATKLGRRRCGWSYPGQLVLLRVQGGGLLVFVDQPPSAAGHPRLRRTRAQTRALLAAAATGDRHQARQALRRGTVAFPGHRR